MTEGDPKVDDWQTWEDWANEPKLPDGFVALGPWFAAFPSGRL